MENFSNEKPALGTLKVGDEVIVLERRYGRGTEQHAAIVTSVARVWIDLKSFEGYRTWRMRLDTQDDGNKNSAWKDRFVTQEQFAWMEKLNAATSYLKKAGVQIEYKSVMDSPAARVALAEMIRREFGA